MIKSIIGSTFQFLLGMLVSIYSAWVLTLFWGWYIIPWIETAPKLPMIIAIGLSLIARFITYNLNLSDMNLALGWTESGMSGKELVARNKTLMWIMKFWNIGCITAFLWSGWIFHFFV